MSIEVTLCVEVSPELLGAIEDLARAIADLAEARAAAPSAASAPALPLTRETPAAARQDIPASDHSRSPTDATDGRSGAPASGQLSTAPAAAKVADTVRAAPPKAAPPPPPAAAPRAWNAARDAEGKKLWREGKSAGEVLAALNELPGDTPISGNQQVHARAYSKGWERPRPPPLPDEPIFADHDTIAAWAAPRGISFTGKNLDEVNARCRALGLRTFVLDRKARAA